MLWLILLFLLKNCLWVTRSPKGYQGGIWAPICSDMGADFPGWLALETPPEPPETVSRALFWSPLGLPLVSFWVPWASVCPQWCYQWVPKVPMGLPRGPKGLPRHSQGVPKRLQGIPAGSQKASAGVPMGFKRCPTGSQGFPKGFQGVPMGPKVVPRWLFQRW